MTAIGPVHPQRDRSAPERGERQPALSSAFAETLRTLFDRAAPDARSGKGPGSQGSAEMFNEDGFFGGRSTPPPPPSTVLPIKSPPEHCLDRVPGDEGQSLATMVDPAPTGGTGDRLRLPAPAALVPGGSAQAGAASARVPSVKPDRATAIPILVGGEVGSAPELPAGLSSDVDGEVVSERQPEAREHGGDNTRSSVIVTTVEENACVSVAIRSQGEAAYDPETLHAAIARLLSAYGRSVGEIRINGRAPNDQTTKGDG